jgi:hypothetical protein
MGQMQKKVQKLDLNVFRRLKISLKVNDFFFVWAFSKGDHLDLPKMGQIIFLIICCNL